MSCPICIEEITELHTTTCNHEFCEHCINRWLQNHNSCPLCRAQLVIEESEEEQNNIWNLINEEVDIRPPLPTHWIEQEEVEIDVLSDVDSDDDYILGHQVYPMIVDTNRITILYNGYLIQNEGFVNVENPQIISNIVIEVSNLTFISLPNENEIEQEILDTTRQQRTRETIRRRRTRNNPVNHRQRQMDRLERRARQNRNRYRQNRQRYRIR